MFIFQSIDLCNETNIHLVNGFDIYEGNVEICINQTWWSVCSDYYSATGSIVCRQLGFSLGE